MIAFQQPLRRYLAHREAYDAAAREVMQSGRYILAGQVAAFEEEFAAFCGVQHCLGLATGTDAIVIALRALGAGPHRSVWTVANAGYYTATAAALVGAPLRFLDVDRNTAVLPDDLVLPPEAEGQVLVVTHLYGNPVAASVFAAARSRHMAIVEDCAQAHGARIEGRPVGTWGDAAAFSFYPTKNLGAFGDGGALVTSDPGLHAEASLLRQYGWAPKYVVNRSGALNSRLDEFQAAFLRVGLKHLAAWNERRRAIVAAYARTAAGPLLLTRHAAGAAPHLAVFRSDDRDRVRDELKARGIATEVHYPVPDHLQPVRQGVGRPDHGLDVTEWLAKVVFSVPLYPELDDAEVLAICDGLDGVG